MSSLRLNADRCNALPVLVSSAQTIERNCLIFASVLLFSKLQKSVDRVADVDVKVRLTARTYAAVIPG